MTVVALAGRRIDAEGAAPRFPLANIARVEALLQQHLSSGDMSALVCSAACGADLIALRVAAALGLRRRVVLPFDAARFRRTSVVDRPGDWGPLYDAIVADVGARDDLVVLDYDSADADAYHRANTAIFDEAEALAQSLLATVTVVLVWDGHARAGDDVTAEFGEEAKRRGLPLTHVPTNSE